MLLCDAISDDVPTVFIRYVYKYFPSLLQYHLCTDFYFKNIHLHFIRFLMVFLPYTFASASSNVNILRISLPPPPLSLSLPLNFIIFLSQFTVVLIVVSFLSQQRQHKAPEYAHNHDLVLFSGFTLRVISFCFRLFIRFSAIE